MYSWASWGGMRTSCHDSDVRLLPLHPLGSSVSSQTIVVRIYASWGGVAAASGLHDQHATCCGLEMHFKYRKGSPGNGRKKRIIKLTRWGIRNKWGATYGDPSGIITVTDGGSGVDRKIGSGRPFHPFSDDQFAPEGCCDGVPVLGGGEARCASRLCCVATTADRRARVY